MTIRSGLVVATRCFVVLSLFQTLLWGLGLSTIRDPEFNLATNLLIFGSLGGVVLLLIGLYVFAGAAVDLMTPKSNELHAETGIRTDDLQAIAFSALGAYILHIALRDTIGTLSYFDRMPFTIIDVTHFILTPLASWAIGLYLLVGAPQVRRWIARLRRAGSDQQ